MPLKGVILKVLEAALDGLNPEKRNMSFEPAFKAATMGEQPTEKQDKMLEDLRNRISVDRTFASRINPGGNQIASE